ncbi:MAG: MopE-related protein [Nannocystaceae bacterium]
MRTRSLRRHLAGLATLTTASTLLACAGGTDLATSSLSGTGNDSVATVTATATATDGTTGPDSTSTAGSADASASDSSSGAADSGTTGPGCEDEICNGLDDDCDDMVDEGCDCEPDDTQSCYSGPRGTAGVGVCTEGTQLCAEGSWGLCEGEVTPLDEACNGVDDDCDDEVDEGFGTEQCGQGICQVTVDTCVDGVPGPDCVPGDPLAQEICGNGLDDTCDGTVDEDCDCNDGETQSCYGGPNGTQGVGLCAAGTQTCAGGQWPAECDGDVLPSAEMCDGLDNDCDAAADENDPGGGGACNTGLVGVCAQGHIHCNAGVLSCTQDVMAGAETCDGLDNDCDTGVDEGNPGGGAACFTGIPGSCSVGVQACSGGAVGCQQTVFPSAEICVNGTDEDCDGTADDGCGCAHSLCVNSTALANGCSSCVSEVCAVDPFCCASGWDAICINEVATICADWSCTTCTHSPCLQGGALVSTCDTGPNCVSTICASDPFCCSTSWDALCVGEVASLCGITC